MRGYHIRISLVAPSAPASSSTATSGSYKQASAIASAASGSRSDTFIPRYLFQQLPSHNPKSSARRNTLSVHSTGAHPHVQNQKRTDYRHGPIRVDWVDFSHMDEVGGFKKVSAGKERETSGLRRGKSFTAFKRKLSSPRGLRN